MKDNTFEHKLPLTTYLSKNCSHCKT